MDGLEVKEVFWEEICIYLMQWLVQKKYNTSVQYDFYGRKGQSQYGIDLVSTNPTHNNIVAQCKFKGRGQTLTWNEILTDLNKTKYYPGDIQKFIVLTNSARDTSISNGINECNSMHSNNKHPPFNISVIYWNQIKNIGFIPKHKLCEYFPGAVKMAEYISSPFDYNIFSNSAEMMQRIISARITEEDLYGLDDIYLSQGFVNDEIFMKIRQVLFDIDDAMSGMAGHTWHLFKPEIRDLTKIFPAGNRFTSSLRQFCNTVIQYGIGGEVRVDHSTKPIQVLRFDDKDDNFRREAYSKISFATKLLVHDYYTDVMGQNV